MPGPLSKKGYQFEPLSYAMIGACIDVQRQLSNPRGSLQPYFYLVSESMCRPTSGCSRPRSARANRRPHPLCG